jgi:hypothetical protein
MIEPALRDKLVAAYASWLDEDDFGQQYAQVGSPRPEAGVGSVASFWRSCCKQQRGL